MSYNNSIMNEYKEMARNKMTICKACPECNGLACVGKTPGCGGKGNGSTFIRNVSKLKEVCLNMNVVASNEKVSTAADFYGQKVALPVYVAPIGNIEVNYGVKISEYDYTEALVKGVGKDSIVFSGDARNVDVLTEPLRVVKDGWIVPTVKPWERDEMKKRFEYVKASSCHVCCCDIDAGGLVALKTGSPVVEFKDLEGLKEIVKLSPVPVIFKGIMTKEAALACLEAGASGIVVSNHGGRVLQDGVSTIEVLEEISQAVNKRMKVFVDGGFRTGYDVFKALALGADGILIGRPFSIAAIGKGEEGVREYLNTLQSELKEAMTMCGCRKISEINRNCVRVPF